MTNATTTQKLGIALKRGMISVLCVVCATAQMMQATLMVARAEEPAASDSTSVTPVQASADPVPSPESTTIVEPVPSVAPESVAQAGLISTPIAPIAPDASSQGSVMPTGSAAPTYVYNQATGQWENDFYTWNPVTHQTTPKTPQVYSYNPVSKAWETRQWAYDAAAQAYVPNTVTSTTPPPSSQISAFNPVPAKVLQGSGAPMAVGPGSTNTNTSTQQANAVFDRFFDASISGNIYQNATSGSAAIMSNTSVGNVSTGQAASMANVINTLNSLWGGSGVPNVTTFLSNINGDVYGDLLVDPGAIAQQQKALGVSNSAQSTSNNLTVNTQANGLIDNTIAVNATSGNVDVNKNTKVGDSETGSAHAVVNVVDVINSNVAAGQSFLGTVNIWGNLNGDILLPPGFLDQVLAGQNKTAPASQNINSTDTSSTYSATNNVSQQISSQIEALAKSGAIKADNNTTVGDVTTGDASTNVQVFNLTNKDIVADDALMVFVNVMGSWVGFIVDNPAGTTSSLLGGGVTTNKTLAADTSRAAKSDVSINNQESNEIRNTIIANAQSGDITADSNTSLGNLTTGAASTTVNIFDIISSRIQLSNWFGILFINVFGSWQGSFGLDTSNGNAPAVPSAPLANTPAGSSASSSGGGTSQAAVPRAFVFRPSTRGNGGDGELVSIPKETFTAVLASQQTTKSLPVSSEVDQSTQKQGIGIVAPVFAGTLLMFLLYRILRRGA